MSNPRQFELFYSGLAGTISVRHVKDALFLSKESEDLYFDVVEIEALEQLQKENYRIRCEKQAELNKIELLEFTEKQAYDRLAEEKAKSQSLEKENLLLSDDRELYIRHRDILIDALSLIYDTRPNCDCMDTKGIAKTALQNVGEL